MLTFLRIELAVPGERQRFVEEKVRFECVDEFLFSSDNLIIFPALLNLSMIQE